MIDYVKMVKCFDTLSERYVLVPVSVEIENFIKRSNWREDIQERRYQKRKVELEENLYYSNHSNVWKDCIYEQIEKAQILEELRDALSKLRAEHRKIIYSIYYENMMISDIATEMGVSSSYISRLVKKIHAHLFEEINRK